MKLTGLDILLTYDCTGRCAHCCYRAGPGQGGRMSVREVEGYLQGAADQSLEGILLFGGEPFLCYDLLHACVGLAASVASRVYVFTNGYWAADPDTARRLLAGLQEAGLDYILFSVDAFHQERIPLERIAIGIEAARELGYRAIDVDNRYLSGPEMDNPYNRRTRAGMARLARLCDLGGVNVHQGPVRMVGRASDELSAHVSPRAAVLDRCPLPDYLGGDLRAPTGVEIHPGGWVNFCAGLALGNARERPLAEILAEYDPESHPIIRVLVEDGPAGLVRLARRHGHSPGGDWADGCRACYEARRLLRLQYPNHLAPAHPYVGDDA